MVLLFVISVGCRDKDKGVRERDVNINININSAEYNRLNVVGGYEYITGGIDGIVVYRKSYDEFVAYERHCPYNSSNCRRIEVLAAPLVIDSGCGSRFLLNDGSLVNGPSKYGMKQYRTYYDGTYLHIYN